jgi:signal transduction histidine kinase
VIIQNFNEMVRVAAGEFVRVQQSLQARINEGKITLQRTRVDLGTEVQQALEVVQRLFALRKHAISMSLPAERIYVMADPVRLGQCFSNLFTNAAVIRISVPNLSKDPPSSLPTLCYAHASVQTD